MGVDPPTPALHRDFRSLRYRLHFDRAQVRRLNSASAENGRWLLDALAEQSGAFGCGVDLTADGILQLRFG